MRKKRKVIFVFGSNLRGLHGKGAAKYALKNYGAEIGRGRGRTGNSYAIPTKNKKLKILPLHRIRYYVSQFIFYAHKNPELMFDLTPIGTGLAGYSHEQIKPLFASAPRNVCFPAVWMCREREKVRD